MLYEKVISLQTISICSWCIMRQMISLEHSNVFYRMVLPHTAISYVSKLKRGNFVLHVLWSPSPPRPPTKALSFWMMSIPNTCFYIYIYMYNTYIYMHIHTNIYTHSFFMWMCVLCRIKACLVRFGKHFFFKPRNKLFRQCHVVDVGLFTLRRYPTTDTSVMPPTNCVERNLSLMHGNNV